MKTLIFYSENVHTRLLSYNSDWLDGFCDHPALAVDTCNLARKNSWLAILPKLRNYALIVFLHSTNSNEILIPEVLAQALLWRKGKLVIFIGNEFKLMPQKIALIRKIKADAVASQLPQDWAEWLYAECQESCALSVPQALNPKIFRPEIPWERRRIDVGIRGFEYPWYLGDKDRDNLVRFVQESKKFSGMALDISSDAAKRFSRLEWAQFLNNCKFTFSTEAGTSYLERDDSLRLRVNAFLDKNPAAAFSEVYEQFIVPYKNPVPGKMISSRHFDAIGTKVVQVMFPGRFNDILRADEHYMALRQDLSNMDEILERFKDTAYCLSMADKTYTYVIEKHTHHHRINELLMRLDQRVSKERG